MMRWFTRKSTSEKKKKPIVVLKPNLRLDVEEDPVTRVPIYEYLLARLDSKGRLPDSNMYLPQVRRGMSETEPIPYGHSEVWLRRPMGPSDVTRAEKIVKLLTAIVHGEMESRRELRALLAENFLFAPLSTLVMHRFSEVFVRDDRHLFDFARQMAFKEYDANCVKLGMLLLAMLGARSDRKQLMILAMHEEFTYYLSMGVEGISVNPESTLWNIAKSVCYQGRIITILLLSHHLKMPSVREWLLLEGFKIKSGTNDLAWFCVDRGNLERAISQPLLSEARYIAYTELLGLLIQKKPEDHAFGYKPMLKVLGHFLRHSKQHGHHLASLITLYRLVPFLEEARERLLELVALGWTEDLISDYLIDVVTLKREYHAAWEMETYRRLQSEDEQFFREGLKAAEIMGQDNWTLLWNRLLEKPEDSQRWKDITFHVNDERVDKLVELAVNFFPIDEFSNGKPQLWMTGADGDKFMIGISTVIKLLRKYPGRGEALILPNIHSVLANVRIVSVETLKAWGPEHWSEEVIGYLRGLAEVEPFDHLRKEIKEMLKKT